MLDRSPSRLDSPRGWLVVASAFVGSFVVFGISYCFGVFLKPIELEFRVGHAAVSALFSTITALSFFATPLTGKIADRYGPRPVVAVGALLIWSGMLLASRVHSFPLLFLTFGVGLGGGVACTYIPSISAVGEWFEVHRDVALGAAISGIGCGTLVAAPLSASLIERYGWRTVFEMFGWGGAGLLLLSSCLLFRQPVAGEKKKSNTVTKVRTSGFALQYACLLFSGIAVYIAFVFLPAYANDMGTGKVAAAGLVGYIGASSVVGRLGLNFLAPRFGLIRIYQSAYLILLISFAVWSTAKSYPELTMFALLMGTGYGGIAAMSPAVAASAFGVEGLGELLGILFTALGVACLLGPPIAGALVDHLHDLKWAAYLAAGSSALALFFAVLLRGIASGQKSE